VFIKLTVNLAAIADFLFPYRRKSKKASETTQSHFTDMHVARGRKANQDYSRCTQHCQIGVPGTR